jgi:hypothetical protein
MNRRSLYLFALVLAPGLALAQRGGKTRAADHESMFGKDDQPQGPALRPRDIEDFSPLRRFVDKRKDLKLNDSQVDALKKSEDQLKKTNEPLMKAVDSLVREMKPPLNMTPEAKSRIDDASAALRETIGKVNESYDAAAKAALATFDADQQTKANEVLAELKQDAEKRMREKLGGRGGMGGGGRGRP